MDKDRIFRVHKDDVDNFLCEMKACGYKQEFVNISGLPEVDGYQFYYVGLDTFYQMDAAHVIPGNHKYWEDYV